jgi:hypothetical protein
MNNIEEHISWATPIIKNERKIFELPNNVEIVFGKGKFDLFVVCVKSYAALKAVVDGGNANVFNYCPPDKQYFKSFKSLNKPHEVWEDFMKLYRLVEADWENTTFKVNNVINKIVRNTEIYPKTRREVFRKAWCVIYAAMVAEEHKERAPLGKRLKALGMHQLLFEGYSAEKAANCSRGLKRPELEKLCKQRGF